MAHSTEVTVKVNDVHELFREHEFDPFVDDAEQIGSIAAMAQLPHLVSRLKEIRLRVLVPAETLTPQTEARVRRALARYCAHAIAEARRKLAAMRWVGLRTFLVGLVFFGISLAASTAVGRLLFIPEGLRTLASESLIIAGWVIMWQPLDTLVAGWWPQWEEERTFKAISAIPLRVAGFEHPSTT
jgi:hypothetical protein